MEKNKNRKKIKSVSVVKNEAVYDIEVENAHNFFANGTLVHNCAEQSLNNFETCCLAEIFLPNIESKKELIDLAKLLYKVNKHSLTLRDTASYETQNIVNKNMRMGIGVTGYLQATEEQRNWLPDVYEELREFDKRYSEENGFPISIKLTTCKPSGCTSLETKIKTSLGVLSMSDLFLLNGITREEVESFAEGTWIDMSESITVKDMNNEDQAITKLYYNGQKPTFDITFEDGSVYTFTGNHKLLTTEGVWKRVDELTSEDEIVSF